MNILGFDLVTLLLIVVGVVFGILAIRWFVAYLNSGGDDRLQEATNRTARWLGAVVAGIGFTIGVGLTQGVDVIGMFFDFLGQHFFLASNLGGIGLGALALNGTISLSTSQYVGLTMAFAALAYFAAEYYEVRMS